MNDKMMTPAGALAMMGGWAAFFCRWDGTPELEVKYIEYALTRLARCVEDAERYKTLRATCCGDEGPGETMVAAWMRGELDESAVDALVDAARRGES